MPEHSGVLLELNLSLDVKQKQFITVRDTRQPKCSQQLLMDVEYQCFDVLFDVLLSNDS